MRVIAHLSDTHLNTDPDRQERLMRVVTSLKRSEAMFDAVVFTGDVSDNGQTEEYQAVAQILGQLDIPVVYCPGNHDRRQPFAQVLQGLTCPSMSDLNNRYDLGDLTVLALDSLVEGDDAGNLHPATLAWVEQQLLQITTPVLLCLHHPPVNLGHPIVDASKLINADELAQVVKQHDHVIGLLAGHAHTGATTRFAGKSLVVAPGIVSTMRLPDESRPGIRPLTDTASPPGFALHLVDGNHLITHFRFVS